MAVEKFWIGTCEPSERVDLPAGSYVYDPATKEVIVECEDTRTYTAESDSIYRTPQGDKFAYRYKPATFSDYQKGFLTNPSRLRDRSIFNSSGELLEMA